MRKMRIPLTSSAALLAAVVLLTGCTIEKVRTTIAMPGYSSPVKPEQVRLLKYGQPAPQPYQVLGKVTVLEMRSAVLQGSANTEWKSANRKIQKAAAAMGADGVIGIYDGNETEVALMAWRSGLAVKWLDPGTPPQPVPTDFIVGLLPISPCPTAVKTSLDIPRRMRIYTQFLLEKEKGYYVLPPQALPGSAGLEEIRRFDEVRYREVGGPDTQLLLELACVGFTTSTIIVSSGVSMQLQVTLLSKKTRQPVLQKEVTGFGSSGFLVGLVDSDGNRARAATAAVQATVKSLPTVPAKAKK